MSRLLPALVVALLVASLTAAPIVDQIRVTPVVGDGIVAASFAAAAAVGPDAREVVHSGLLLQLTFALELKRSSGAWWDRTVSSETVSSSVKFDNLSGIYQVSHIKSGHVTWSDRTRDFSKAREWLTTFERVPLAKDAQLEPNTEYYIRVRVRATPRRTFSFWPWGSDDGVGRADFTFIR
jgi:Domain of unknown function (DUF4390)